MNKYLPVMICAVLLSSCTTIGPRQLEHSFIDYNEAILSAHNKQILLNLVRMANGETPQLLEITTVAAAFDLTRSAKISGSLNNEFQNNLSGDVRSKVDKDVDIVGGEMGISYTEKPTMSYKPLSGKDFSEQFLQAWSSEDLESTLGAVNDTGLLAYLFWDGAFEGTEKEFGLNGAGALEGLRERNPSIRQESQDLNIQFDRAEGTESNVTKVTPRRLLSIMSFLAQQVPTGELEVLQTAALKVHRTKTRPEAAHVAVGYEGFWYWIDDADRPSKEVFSLLSWLTILRAPTSQPPGLIIGL